jgi:hypothetical protein
LIQELVLFLDVRTEVGLKMKQRPVDDSTNAIKDRNPLKPEEVTLSLNSQSVWYLDRLIETGLYGNTRPQAAAIAIFDHCKLPIAQEKLKMAPTLPGSDAVQVART